MRKKKLKKKRKEKRDDEISQKKRKKKEKRNNRRESGGRKREKGLTDLRDDALRQGPPIHFDLVLHVLDLLLQCVLVHVGEYTGIHGYSRASLFPDNSRIALAPLRKINRTGYVWGLLLLEHQTYVTHWQQEIRFCEEKCTYFFPHRDLRKKITLWISFFLVSRTYTWYQGFDTVVCVICVVFSFSFFLFFQRLFRGSIYLIFSLSLFFFFADTTRHHFEIWKSWYWRNEKRNWYNVSV